MADSFAMVGDDSRAYTTVEIAQNLRADPAVAAKALGVGLREAIDYASFGSYCHNSAREVSLSRRSHAV